MIYRVLIVDDEEIIADSIYCFLMGIEGMELDLHRAYSSSDAMDMIRKSRFDILITDICMPDINGFELIKNLRLLWPDCRIIVVSGYKDFDYAYHALQMDGVRYILKTEGYDRILFEVKKIVNEIEGIRATQEKSGRVEARMKEMAHLVRQTYLHQILSYGYDSANMMEYVRESFNLSAAQPVLMLICRVDGMMRVSSLAERNTCFSAIDIILEGYLKEHAKQLMYIDTNELIWLIQCPETGGTLHSVGVELPQFIWEMLPVIQDQCMIQTGVSTSFVVADKECDWSILHEKKRMLSSMLDYSVGRNKGILIRENNFPLYRPDEPYQANELTLVDIQYLENCIKAGDYNSFIREARHRTDWMLACTDKYSPAAASTFCALVMLFMPYIRRLSKQCEVLVTYPARLLNLSYYKSWDEALHTFYELAEKVFELMENMRSDDSSFLIKKVMLYITENISSDLSLTYLAELVHFSPSYLSRLFKQITGYRLQDYITEMRILRAKELLDTTTLRIYDIAEQTGFGSPKYFNAAFKQKTGTPPNEWRNRSNKAG